MNGTIEATDHPWERIYHSQGNRYTEPFPRFDEVCRHFIAEKCSSILDLGCGAGRHTVALSKNGFTVTGLDISATGLDLARKWLVGEKLPASLVQADMRRPLPFAAGSFEGLFSTQVIHHALAAEVQSTIGEIWRVMSPGGLGFVTVAADIGDESDHELIEPGTYLPKSGPEQGLPHHIFTQDRLAAAFHRFDIKELSLRAEGKVWALLVQKPILAKSRVPCLQDGAGPVGNL